MAATTLDVELKKYYSLLNTDQKKSVIKMLKAFVQADNRREETIDDYNADIEKAIAEYKKGEVMSHEAVLKMAKKW